MTRKQNYDHAFTVRVTRELIARAKVKSAITGVSISDFIRQALKEWTSDVGVQLELDKRDK